MERIRIISQNYTKEVAKQVLRSTIVITKKIFNKVLELQNEVTKPTDIFEDKRNIPVI